MRVPLLDLGAQYRALAEPLRVEVNEVLASQAFILGPKGAALEAAVAQYCQIPHAIAVSSGTDAILAALMALGIGPGDSVLTTSFTFFATGGCIARVGATPVFADIDPKTYNIAPEGIARYVREKCRRDPDGKLRDEQGRVLRAILPVHLFGLCCDMQPILKVAGEAEIPVIEDAAQAIGADYPRDGRAAQAGTMGVAGCFSFYPTKNLGAAGDAGMVICHDDALAQKLRACRQHGMEERYFHHFIGGNFRLDEMQAAVLKVKLPHLDAWSAARLVAADFYREEFERRGLTTDLLLPTEPYRDHGGRHHIYHQFVIRTSRRDALRTWLHEKEIGTAIYYPLGLHQQECFSYLGYREGDLPETERAARETLALPIYPELTREQQLYVVEAIEQFYSSAASR